MVPTHARPPTTPAAQNFEHTHLPRHKVILGAGGEVPAEREVAEGGVRVLEACGRALRARHPGRADPPAHTALGRGLDPADGALRGVGGQAVAAARGARGGAEVDQDPVAEVDEAVGGAVVHGLRPRAWVLQQPLPAVGEDCGGLADHAALRAHMLVVYLQAGAQEEGEVLRCQCLLVGPWGRGAAAVLGQEARLSREGGAHSEGSVQAVNEPRLDPPSGT